MKYYNDKVNPFNQSIYLNFFFLSKNRELISRHLKEICFAYLNRSVFNPTAKYIQLIHPENKVPYSKDFVESFIKDLNEMGFYCKLSKPFWGKGSWSYNDTVLNENDYVFELDLKKFEKRVHLLNTLVMIRTLIEPFADRVPSYYKEIIEANPSVDKFIALQQAHKKIDKRVNVGHIVVPLDSEPVSKEDVWEYYKSLKGKTYQGNQNYGTSESQTNGFRKNYYRKSA